MVCVKAGIAVWLTWVILLQELGRDPVMRLMDTSTRVVFRVNNCTSHRQMFRRAKQHMAHEHTYTIRSTSSSEELILAPSAVCM